MNPIVKMPTPVCARRSNGTTTTCKSIGSVLIEFMFDELPLAERQRVEEHLAQCALCRRRYALTWSVVSAVGASGTPETGTQSTVVN
jgi:hypothetical protein